MPWGAMILRDIMLTTALALGERTAERIFLPGLHRMHARALTADPARIDGLSVFFGDVIGLLVLIWMFVLGLYTFSIFTKRPIQTYAAALVGGGLMVVTFIGSTAEWFAMPALPSK